jgi:hypothetical protein
VTPKSKGIKYERLDDMILSEFEYEKAEQQIECFENHYIADRKRFRYKRIDLYVLPCENPKVSKMLKRTLSYKFNRIEPIFRKYGMYQRTDRTGSDIHIIEHLYWAEFFCHEEQDWVAYDVGEKYFNYGFNCINYHQINVHENSNTFDLMNKIINSLPKDNALRKDIEKHLTKVSDILEFREFELKHTLPMQKRSKRMREKDKLK